MSVHEEGGKLLCAEAVWLGEAGGGNPHHSSGCTSVSICKVQVSDEWWAWTLGSWGQLATPFLGRLLRSQALPCQKNLGDPPTGKQEEPQDGKTLDAKEESASNHDDLGALILPSKTSVPEAVTVLFCSLF